MQISSTGMRRQPTLVMRWVLFSCAHTSAFFRVLMVENVLISIGTRGCELYQTSTRRMLLIQRVIYSPILDILGFSYNYCLKQSIRSWEFRVWQCGDPSLDPEPLQRRSRIIMNGVLKNVSFNHRCPIWMTGLGCGREHFHTRKLQVRSEKWYLL